MPKLRHEQAFKVWSQRKAEAVNITGGQLSRVIPAHRRTVTFNWCKRDFMVFGEFKAARLKMRMDIVGFSECYWCHKPFEEADMMALAQHPKGANKVLCQECAGSLSPTVSVKHE